MNRKFFFAIFSITTLLPMAANARQEYVDKIPNGDDFACATCHVAPLGGGVRNDFGAAVEAEKVGTGTAATIDWSELGGLDSDGDGEDNGVELNAPDDWEVADGHPGGSTSNPGDPDSTLGGEGEGEGEEETVTPPTGLCSANPNSSPWEWSNFGFMALALLAIRRRR